MIGLKTITIDNKKYYYLSPHYSHKLVFQLSQLINKSIRAGKMEKPELIVGIARGSLAWLKTLADWLNIDNIYTIRVVHYNNVAKRLEKPTLLESHLPRTDKARVLVFDNVIETGKTMKLAFNYLQMKGAEKIYTSSLFYKNNAKFKPDFYTLKTDAWIIFHFDIMETVKLLGSKWLNKQVDLQTIFRRFIKLGLPKNEVKTAMELIFNFS
jgi:uncharacterized protein